MSSFIYLSSRDDFCVFVTLPCDVLGQVWYLIVLIPDLCLLPYFVRLVLQIYSIQRCDRQMKGSKV